MKARKALKVVESAYDLERPNTGWLKALSEEAAAMVDGAHGAYAMEYHLRPGERIEIVDAYIPGVEDALARSNEVCQVLSPEETAMWYPPGTIEGTFEERFASLFEGDDPSLAEKPRALARQFGGQDMIAFGGRDAGGTGLILGVVIDPTRLVGAARATQQRVGVHLTTALRLRKTLGTKDVLGEAEAVFEADGKLAHAQGEATSLRSVLEQQVTRVDRARARPGTENPLEVWKGLVEGRWSLIDRIDTDGRRYYVALVNPATGVESRALTESEAQIVAMVVAGEPNKVIAYALGLAQGTVAARLSEAIRKLGLSSRSELIRFGQTLLGA